jgi:hypothetical protein
MRLQIEFRPTGLVSVVQFIWLEFCIGSRRPRGATICPPFAAD